jgi:hypothetical protein
MLERLRSQIGAAGLVVAIVALVAALGGGAYAATGSSGGAKATASAKGKPGPRGKTGPAGPAGPAGAAGPQGPAGPMGAAGSNGSNGEKGAAGANGQSVNSSLEAPGGNCANGGSKFVASTTTYACNGAPGAKGSTGSPWTAGGILPKGATETGSWGYGAFPAPDGKSSYPISFPVPLAAVPPVTFVDVFSGETSGTGCPGIVNGTPTANEGRLCVYATGFYEAQKIDVSFLTTSGGFVVVNCPVAEECSSNGVFAVTGA